MSGDILDAIDGALRDWTTSQDGMRWQPPEQQSPEQRPEPVFPPGTFSGGAVVYVMHDGQWQSLGSVTERVAGMAAWVAAQQAALAQVVVRATASMELVLQSFDPSVLDAWARGAIRRPSPRWLRYPQDGEAVSRCVSNVCRGWLCGSCTDHACAHTCHGGHLR